MYFSNILVDTYIPMHSLNLPVLWIDFMWQNLLANDFIDYHPEF